MCKDRRHCFASPCRTPDLGKSNNMSRQSQTIVPDSFADLDIEILSVGSEHPYQPEVEEFCDVLASIVHRVLTEEQARELPLAE